MNSSVRALSARGGTDGVPSKGDIAPWLAPTAGCAVAHGGLTEAWACAGWPKLAAAGIAGVTDAADAGAGCGGVAGALPESAGPWLDGILARSAARLMVRSATGGSERGAGDPDAPDSRASAVPQRGHAGATYDSSY